MTPQFFFKPFFGIAARKLLTFTMAFSIAIQSVPLQLMASGTSASEESVSSGVFHSSESKSADLVRAIEAPSSGQAELDTFDLLRQEVPDDRPEVLKALVEARMLEDYMERIAFLEEQKADLISIQRQAVEKASLANGDRSAELTTIVEDIKSRLAIVELELEDIKQFDPRNGTSLKVDLMIDEEIATRNYWGKDLRVRLFGEKGHSQILRQSDFSRSLSPIFKKLGLGSNAGLGSTQGIELVHPDGTVLNRILIPSEAVTFFGRYLVFLESQSKAEGETIGHRKVRFIDLNYFKANLGNSPIPIFTFPLNQTSDQLSDLRNENGSLVIGNTKLSHQQFELLSQTQQLIFNVNVALVDPNSFAEVGPLIDHIQTAFTRSMQSQKDLFDSELQRGLGDPSEAIAQVVSKLKAVTPKTMRAQGDSKNGLSDAQNALEVETADRLLKSNQSLKEGRRFTVRMELFFRHLISPRPDGAPMVLESLLLSAFGGKQKRAQVAESYKGTRLPQLAKYGAAAATAVLLSQVLPEPYQIHLHQSLDLISAVGQHFYGYLLNMDFGLGYYHLAKDAFLTSATGWTFFKTTYLTDSKWINFLIGLGHVLMVPLQLFAALHLSINSLKMAGLVKSNWVATVAQNSVAAANSILNRASRLLGRSRDAFVQSVNQDQKQYWASLAEAEKRSSGSDAEQLSQAEVELLQGHLDRLRSGKASIESVRSDLQSLDSAPKRLVIKRVTERASGFIKLKLWGDRLQAKAAQHSKAIGTTDVEGFWQALKSAFVSYSALRTTFKSVAITWNYFFITRSFVFSPTKWLMAAIFPNYFSVAVSKGKGRQHYPSSYNSGTETWLGKLWRMTSAGANRFAGSRFTRAILIAPEALLQLAAFEDAVYPVEEAAIGFAMKEAQSATLQRIESPAALAALFDSANPKILDDPKLQLKASTGIRTLYDPKLHALSSRDRTFFRAVFTRSYDEFMKTALNKIVSRVEDGSEFQFLSGSELKRSIRRGEVQFNWSALPQSREQLISETVKSIDKQSILVWAHRVSENLTAFGSRIAVNFRHTLLDTLHPGNAQIKRFMTAKEKVEDPRAMERAMRMEVANMITAVPMALISTLVLYAGVTTGLLDPFDPNGLDTETHFLYMSKYLFYSGFIPGVIIGMLANTWLKVQEDARVDALGGFDTTLSHKDSQQGFWRFYLKNFTSNPKNKWRDNHTYILKLITANIPAAAVTFSITYLYGLGRIDIGAFLAGYILVYTTFLSGFGVKLGQAFELSSSWVYAKVPRKLRAAPAAQKYFGSELQRAKNWFSFYENIWKIGVEETIAGTMMTLKDNAQYGTRAFLRLVFGGDTPTEIIVGFIQKLNRALSSIPGVQTVADGLIKLFAHNYEAYQRFPDAIGATAETVAKFNELQSTTGRLPGGVVTETLGKSLGAIATMGASGVAPYLVTDYLQKRRERQLQAQGAAVMGCRVAFQSL